MSYAPGRFRHHARFQKYWLIRCLGPLSTVGSHPFRAVSQRCVPKSVPKPARLAVPSREAASEPLTYR